MAHFWFAFDVGAYEDSTAHLTMLQDGAYNRLLRHYYKTGKPIPEDAGQIQRISGAHSVEELEAVTYILNTFFTLKYGSYHNKRADNELIRAREVSKLRKELGKKGGLAKARAIAIANGIAKEQAKSYTVTVTDTNTKEESKNKAQSAFCLPEWVPQKEWQDFEDMRRKLRKPMTDRARALIVAELFKLRTRYDIAAVLEQSIRNSWQDVYELKGNTDVRRSNSSQKPAQRQPTRSVERFVNNYREVHGSDLGRDSDAVGAGQEVRASAGDNEVLEGEIIQLQPGGNP